MCFGSGVEENGQWDGGFLLWQRFQRHKDVLRLHGGGDGRGRWPGHQVLGWGGETIRRLCGYSEALLLIYY